MKIRNEDEFRRAREALENIENILGALKNDKDKIHPTRYAMMAEPALRSLKELRSAIDQYTGVALAEERVIPIWIRIEGNGISQFGTPVDLIEDTLKRFRRGIESVANFIHDDGDATLKHPEIEEACRFELAGIADGSLMLGLQTPDFNQESPDVDKDCKSGSIAITKTVDKAIKTFIDVAAWAGSESPRDYLGRDNS